VRQLYCLALTIAAAATASASADQWNLTFTGMGPHQVVGVNFGAARAYNAGPVNSFSNLYTGRMNWTGPGSRSYSTFCTQINEYVNFGQTVQFTPTSPTNVPDGPGSPGPMGDVKSALLQDLYARHYNSVAGSNDANLNAAFQLAVWEITHENLTADDAASAVSQLNVGLGALQANSTSGTVFNLANSLLASLGGEDDGYRTFGGLLGLTNLQYQDQLVVVPVPAALGLAAAGLAGVIGVRRRLRRG
jgi:hypothetical protein